MKKGGGEEGMEGKGGKKGREKGGKEGRERERDRKKARGGVTHISMCHAVQDSNHLHPKTVHSPTHFVMIGDQLVEFVVSVWIHEVSIQQRPLSQHLLGVCLEVFCHSLVQ